MEDKLLSLLTSGGMQFVVFVIWYITVKNQNKQFKEILQQGQDNVKQIFKLIEEDTKYKELLTGILTRLEIKLDLVLNNKKEN
jgi:hypothetical protein